MEGQDKFELQQTGYFPAQNGRGNNVIGRTFGDLRRGEAFDTLEAPVPEMNYSEYNPMQTQVETGFVGFENVSKRYSSGKLDFSAIEDVSFSIGEGELVIMLGASGAGKSTALNLLGGMDTVTTGRIVVNHKAISGYTLKELAEYRRKEIGFVFQFYNLMPNLTAKENIQLVTEMCERPLDPMEALRSVGLEDKANHFPSQLSGGEQQRVSIARALAKSPLILLCDEPTGALDYETGKQILELLQRHCHERKITTIIVTHNGAITPMADTVIHFRSGRVVDIMHNKNPVAVENIEWQ